MLCCAWQPLVSCCGDPSPASSAAGRPFASLSGCVLTCGPCWGWAAVRWAAWNLQGNRTDQSLSLMSKRPAVFPELLGVPMPPSCQPHCYPLCRLAARLLSTFVVCTWLPADRLACVRACVRACVCVAVACPQPWGWRVAGRVPQYYVCIDAPHLPWDS